jgi:outer membrane protein TolC
MAERRLDGDVAPSPAARSGEPRPAPPQETAVSPAIIAQLARGGATVSLAQLIDFALRTSPATRATWSDARAAAAVVGSKRSTWYPQIEVDGNLGFTHQTLGLTGLKFEYKSWGPSAQLSWLLLDLGTRSADIDEAKALLASANLAHDTAVADLVLGVAQAYTQYQSAKAQLVAQKASVSEAQTAYDAADERRRTGVATIADVLQAKTALSQAQFQLQSVEGQLNILRGAVATAVGVPATVPIEAEELPQVSVDPQLARIEELIGQAERDRPELARARVQALAAQSHAASVKWRGWPQLVLNANASRNYFITQGAPYGDNYGAALLLRIPVFTGFKDSFDAAQAEEQARAALARAESVEQQVVLQVWSSYQAVRTAAQRVRTAHDLLASAEQSEQVAAGRYKEGVGSILDVLTAQSALALARAQEVQARADWILSVASLAHDTGSLGPPRASAREGGGPAGGQGSPAGAPQVPLRDR